ncbi:MAG: gliding motility lipoprotein GldB [Chitinophagales bacterium]|nr:MAG: gliding motility lipoprotein GldB [Chitinophagales bacterium]
MRLYRVILCFLLLGISGCQCGKNRKKVDLSGIELNLTIHRLEEDIFTLDTTRLEAEVAELDSQYHGFVSFYAEQILGLGSFSRQPGLTFHKLAAYLRDPYVLEVRDSCHTLFGDFSRQAARLERALRHVKYYFPQKKIPEIVTFLSNFSYAALTYDTFYLGIGLDMYLGKDFKYYPSLFPQYLYEKFSEEYLVANSMKALAGYYFNPQPKDNRLISQMIVNGIVLYFTDLTLPDEEDYVKIGYRPEDIQWCQMNEPEIWKYFIDRELLYSTAAETNRRYVTPGPSTTGMPRESPGNVGTWVGWQIVRAYMKKFPDTPFEELLKKDPQEILVLSGYKPNRRLL